MIIVFYLEGGVCVEYIEYKANIHGGSYVIKGTRIRPEDIVYYGKVEDFDLNLDQVMACYEFCGIKY